MSNKNKVYTIDRNKILDMEFVRAEMELKLMEAQIKNHEKRLFNVEYPDAERKIKIMADSINYVCELSELIEKISKINIEKELTIKQLLAENLMLRSK